MVSNSAPVATAFKDVGVSLNCDMVSQSRCLGCLKSISVVRVLVCGPEQHKTLTPRARGITAGAWDPTRSSFLSLTLVGCATYPAANCGVAWE